MAEDRLGAPEPGREQGQVPAGWRGGLCKTNGGILSGAVVDRGREAATGQ